MLQICWFDRQSVIATNEFDIFQDFNLLVVLIVALSRFSLEDWGIDEKFYPKGGFIETTVDGTPIRINTTDGPLCHRVNLLGRGTSVLQGNIVGGAEMTPVAIKVSYPEVGRVPEPYFIRQGSSALCDDGPCENLPFVHAWEDLPGNTGAIRQLLQLGEKGQARQRRVIVLELLENLALLDDGTDAANAWVDCVCGEVLRSVEKGYC